MLTGKDVARELNNRYPITTVTEEPWKLVLTAILATQVNFDNVEKIRGTLLDGKSLKDIANASFEQVYEVVKHIRFGRVKAQRVIDCAKKLLVDCDGQVPNDPNYLETLPGIGHKNAAVIQSMYFNTPSIAVDTHVIRICGRLGITNGTHNVKAVEEAMKNFFEESCWSRVHQQFMYFGREICKARSPQCDRCPFYQECLSSTHKSG